MAWRDSVTVTRYRGLVVPGPSGHRAKLLRTERAAADAGDAPLLVAEFLPGKGLVAQQHAITRAR